MTWVISLIILSIIGLGNCSGSSDTLSCLLTQIQFDSAGLNNLIDLYKPLFQFLSLMVISIGLGLANHRSKTAIQQITNSEKQFLHSEKKYEQKELFDKIKEFRDYVKEFKESQNRNLKSDMVKQNLNAYTMIRCLFNDDITELKEKASSSIRKAVMDYYLLNAEISMYLSRTTHMEIDDEAKEVLNGFDLRLFNLSKLVYYSFNNRDHSYRGTFEHIDIFEDCIYIAHESAAFCGWSYADIHELLNNIHKFREKLKEYCDPYATCDFGIKTMLAGVEAKRRPKIAEHKKKSDDMFAKMGVQVPRSKSPSKY